jgi:hypothetical protein
MININVVKFYIFNHFLICLYKIIVIIYNLNNVLFVIIIIKNVF